MFCPAHFEENNIEVLTDFITQYPLATIITSKNNELTANHIPLQLVDPMGIQGKLIGHVARANTLWQIPDNQEHLIIFQGPSSYISPNWYATKAETHKVVPTWNYAVVHVYATLKAIHEPALILDILNRQTSQQENSQSIPWQISDAPKDFIDRLLQNIVGIEFEIKRIKGKFKVSQNQPATNQQSVIRGLSELENEGSLTMAQLVQQYAKPVDKP